MNPANMADFILGYVAHPESLDETKAHLSDYQNFSGKFEEIFKLVYEKHGINLEDYKPATVNRRIYRRIRTLMFNTTAEYVERLKEDPSEVDALTKDLIIGVTSFFRDERTFAFVATNVIPQLFQSEKDHVRIWVCGCSSGEEAYSIAMLCEEYLTQSRSRKNYKIFATDISQSVISHASQGVFPKEILAEFQNQRLVENYFVDHKNGMQIKQNIRNNIVFTTQNVITDPPFTRMNMITCRNLLIYLKPDVQKKVISNFHFGLKKNGFLFMGTSENLGDLQEEFNLLDLKHKVFSKKREVRISSTPSHINLDRATFLGVPLNVSGKVDPAPRQSLAVFEYDTILKEIVPNGIVINERNEITHLFGEARNLIDLSEGRFGSVTDILQLIRKPLKVPLSTALLQARKAKSRVVLENIEYDTRDESVRYKLTVRPLSSEKKSSQYTLILLEEQKTGDSKPVETQSIHVDENAESLISELQRELQQTRESLQATIEEVETTNEELQSTNEELLASNEELQSTNEELQSVNEELYTVNTEHQEKIRELTELNNDMDNLLISTDIGTIFIDDQLCIRKFTPQIQKSFNILPHDVGRSIEHFNYLIKDYPELIRDIKSVFKTGVKFERDVQDPSGQWYLFRITPYIVDTKVCGTVLSMIEIDSIKKAEERFKLAVEASPNAMIMVDSTYRISLVNKQAEALFHFSREELLGQRVESLLPPENRESHSAFMREYFNNPTAREMGRGRELHAITKEGRTFPVEVGLTPVKIDGEYHIISSIVDLTERKKTEAALQQQQIKLVQSARMASIGEMAAGIAHEINNPLTILKGRMKSIHNLLDKKDLDEVKIETITKKMDGTIDRVSSIIKGLRTFSRDGEQDLIKITTVNELVQDTFDFCKKRVEADGILLKTELMEPSVQLRCRPVQISQVLLNLIQNSRDAIIDHEHPWIEIKSWKGSNEIYLSVTDSGKGIKGHARERIFDPFFTTKEVGKGTGLGLSLSKEIIEGHGGTLALDEDSEHTRFVLSLPTDLDKSH